MEPDALFFKDGHAFGFWLEANADVTDSIWIKMAKKSSGIASLDWKNAVDVALCFGWIDGQSRRIDDTWFIQRFTPRRPQSTWSKVNRRKVEDLIAAGRMRAAGMAEIERAKRDERWDAAYDGMATASVPDDLASRLEQEGLAEAFAALDSRNRYAILHAIQTARRDATRVQRIDKYIEMLKAGQKPFP